MKWYRITDLKPPIGRLVYTKDDQGNIGAHTLYNHGWNSQINTDNNVIVEWLDVEDSPTAVINRSTFYCNLVGDYQRYMAQGQRETALLMLDHLVYQVNNYVRNERVPMLPHVSKSPVISGQRIADPMASERRIRSEECDEEAIAVKEPSYETPQTDSLDMAVRSEDILTVHNKKRRTKDW